VEQLVVRILRTLRISAGTSGDRLGALSLAISQDAEGVHRERLPLAPILQMLADAGKVPVEPRRRRAIHFVGHGRPLA
jgi:hypothetical protein